MCSRNRCPRWLQKMSKGWHHCLKWGMSVLREIATSRLVHSNLEARWAFTGGHPTGGWMHKTSRGLGKDTAEGAIRVWTSLWLWLPWRSIRRDKGRWLSLLLAPTKWTEDFFKSCESSLPRFFLELYINKQNQKGVHQCTCKVALPDLMNVFMWRQPSWH